MPRVIITPPPRPTPDTSAANGSAPDPDAPGPVADAPTARAEREMHPLPPRGDGVARRYWLIGIAAYFALSTALVWTLVFRSGHFDATEVFTLFGVGDHPNLAVALLVGLGVAVTVIAGWRVGGDVRRMKDEEDDIAWVHRTGPRGFDLVYFEDAVREPIFRRRDAGESVDAPPGGKIKTLLDERVHRVQLANASGGVVVPAELRGVAEVRTAAYGAFARHAASLLLLLAVLGTFAGVKTALPNLIDAISSTTSNNQGLVDALSAVASAFGGNALALVGAVAIGLMAQGVSMGRRNLLERLELVSVDLYADGLAAEANSMQGAVVALREGARQLERSSSAMLNVEDALEELGNQFHGGFERLGDRLRDVAAAQEKGLHDRTADTLVGLQRQVEGLARSVDGNAQVYAGLADAVRTRADDTTDALKQMRATNQQLADALRGVVAAGQQTAAAFEQLRGAAAELKRGSESTDARLTALATAVQGMHPTFAALGDTLSAATERLRAGEEASRRGWEQVGEQVAQRMADAVEAFRALDARAVAALDGVRESAVVRVPATSGGGAADPEVPRLLRELVTVSRGQPARPAWHAAVVPFAAVVAGVTLGGGVMYALVHPAQQESQAAVERLQPTLDRLGDAVARLQASPGTATRPAPDSTAASAGAGARR